MLSDFCTSQCACVCVCEYKNIVSFHLLRDLGIHVVISLSHLYNHGCRRLLKKSIYDHEQLRSNKLFECTTYNFNHNRIDFIEKLRCLNVM